MNPEQWLSLKWNGGSTMSDRWLNQSKIIHHTLFSSADETSLGTTRHFLSIYLPHLLQLIPSSYWTLVCLATLSLTIA